jgi:hypothetical protein
LWQYVYHVTDFNGAVFAIGMMERLAGIGAHQGLFAGPGDAMIPRGAAPELRLFSAICRALIHVQACPDFDRRHDAPGHPSD